MERRWHKTGIMAGLACVLACGVALGQAPALAQIPEPKAAPAKNLASGQTAASADTALTAPRKLHGEAESLGVVTQLPSEPLDPPEAAVPGVVVDQGIGVVNGDLILESDVDYERRFEVFEPFSAPGSSTRDKIVERLIDRTLILQQSKLQPGSGVPLDKVKAQLQSLREDLPACKGRCETEAGWEKFVSDHGFTMEQLTERWQQRMEILKFIEMRFRAGIEVTPAEIQAYYTKNMLPVYAKAKQTPPKLAVIGDRVQEVLLEQKVSGLLSDWLQSLKAEGNVRMMRPGEVQP